MERAGPSIGIEQARRLVRELSPLAAGTVEWLGAGTDSAAVRVDGEWVVRFPLVPDAQATLSTELALLPLLASRLPVAVPRPEHVAERDGQLVFVAYRALEGQPLSDAALSALSPSARGRALDELAALLDAIHGVPVEPARTAGVSFALHKGAYHAAQQSLERELTGLLDWGDASFGHAEFDLAIVGAFCGPQTLQGLLDRLAAADAERPWRASPSCSRSAGSRTPTSTSAGATSLACAGCTSTWWIEAPAARAPVRERYSFATAAPAPGPLRRSAPHECHRDRGLPPPC